MADAAVTGYAEALFAVASVEGDLSAVEDELFNFAQALRSNDELRSTLADGNVPAARRLQVVDDLLAGRASATTSVLVSMVVGAGRASELPSIVDAFIERSAASRNKESKTEEPCSSTPTSSDATLISDIESDRKNDPLVIGSDFAAPAKQYRACHWVIPIASK